MTCPTAKHPPTLALRSEPSRKVLISWWIIGMAALHFAGCDVALDHGDGLVGKAQMTDADHEASVDGQPLGSDSGSNEDRWEGGSLLVVDASEAESKQEAAGRCPSHAQLKYDNCVCDDGYVFDEDCSDCVEVSSAEACPHNTYLSGKLCLCQVGYGDELTCGCNPRDVGAECENNSDCFDEGVCLTSLVNFGWFTPSDLPADEIPLPAGYCSVRLCSSSQEAQDACYLWSGTCAIVQAGGVYGELCLGPCDVDEQCRPGYRCRALAGGDVPGNPSTVEVHPNDTFCLPEPLAPPDAAPPR